MTDLINAPVIWDEAELARRKHLEFIQFMWQRGDPLIIGQHTRQICGHIDTAINDFENGKSSFLAIKTPFRHGKKIHSSEKVLTPNGYVPHGSLKVGDIIYGRYGQEIKVLAVGEETKDVDNIVGFSDGTEIIAHDNHEWVVYDRGPKREKILETKKMATRLYHNNKRPCFMIDSNVCVNFGHKDLPLHPYILGVWLGDGSVGKNIVTLDQKDRDIILKIKSLGMEQLNEYIHPNYNTVHASFVGLTKSLREAEVFKKKYIPHDYIYSSKEQRLDLLAGLIDTDGYINKKDGRVVFSNTNKDIIDAVKIIVNSLGQRVTICEYPPRTSSSGIIGRKMVYQLLFIPPCDIPMVLSRKKCVLFKKGRRRSITSIKKTNPVKGQCIQVEGGVYLVGESNIPTHNSDMVARFLPANFIGKHPSHEVIVSGYSFGLVRKFSRDSRAIMRDERYRYIYPQVGLSKDSQSLEEWGVASEAEKSQGSVYWTGLGGAVTGRGGALIVIDDFFSARMEAESQLIRDNVWEAITNDILTRRAPVCIVIILATPWHIDDPFGRIQKKMADDPLFPKFKEIRFPAFDDKYPEGILFPERFPKEWYLSQKALLGPYGTASLLQCDPSIKSGNQLRTDKIKIINEDQIPPGIIFARGWDLASSEKERFRDDPDFTAGLKLGIQWKDSGIKGEPIPVLYVSDLVHGQWEAPKRDTTIRDTAGADGKITIGVESFGPYKDAYIRIRELLSGIRVVKKIQLPGDKVAKASVLEPIFESGNIHIVRAPWNDKFIKEVADFPGGTHDDIVDALVAAYHCHSPHLRRVFPDFDYTHVLDFKIDFQHISENSCLIVSSWLERNLETSFVMGLWSRDKSRLFIFADYIAPNPYPQSTVINIASIIRECSGNSKRDVKGFEWYGNSLMFSKKDNMQTEYRRRGVHIREAANYNEYSAVSRVATLMKYSAVKVHSRCGDLIRQLQEWVTTDKPLDKPGEVDGFGLCRALSLMASMMYETGKMRPPKKKITPYSRESQAYKKQLETASRSGKLEEFSMGAKPQSNNKDGWMGI